MKLQRTILLFTAAIGVTMAADSPFIGKWKFNPAKSQFTGTTMMFESLPSGEMQMTAGGESYKFKMDGKEYPAEFGSSSAWKQIDANNFETVNKMGTMTSVMTTKISADGKTLTMNSKGKKPNGEDMTESATYERMSGGPGLAGKWKSTKVQESTEMWEITANGADGLTMTILDYNASCPVKFDQKDYPCTGPTTPKNFTMAAKKTNDRTIVFTGKIGGKPLFNDVFTVSADGKTFTDDSQAAGTSEKVKMVYDKQ